MAGQTLDPSAKISGDYQKYSIMSFPSFAALKAFAEKIRELYPSVDVQRGMQVFAEKVDIAAREPVQKKWLGLFGKGPLSYDEAMKREKFVYWDEYKVIKQKVLEQSLKIILKESEANVDSEKFVYNDMQLGEFVFSRAAMSMKPLLYLYSFVHKREIQETEEKVDFTIVKGKEKITLASDGTDVYRCLRVTKEDGSYEYVVSKGDESLKEAAKKGIISITSNNNKVYLYKPKQPKPMKAVKLFVGLTGGGFTRWDNDFYTGIAAVVTAELLESFGYAVHIEVCMGGGRCGGCALKLRFNNMLMKGRRFFTFTAKGFNDPMDLESLLYTCCDPSFHSVKFWSLFNTFLSLYGDQLDKPNNVVNSMTWHGLEHDDLTNPIGLYMRKKDIDKGIGKSTIYYSFWRVSEDEVVNSIVSMILEAQNINNRMNKLYESKFGKRVA